MKILVSIGGYGGSGAEPITLFANRDEATGVLVVLKQHEYTESPKPGHAFVTNMKLADYDCLFKEEHLGEAIRAYKEAQGMDMIILAPDAQKYAPRIQTDGIDTQGQKYRLHENMSNGELAVLALTHFMSRQRAISATTGAADKMFSMYEIFSV